MSTDLRGAVKEFLTDMKSIINAHGIVFVPRRDLTKTFPSLGITESVARDEILNLSASDYVSGPSSDENGLDGEVWIFGSSLDEKEVYIKLKIYGPIGSKKAKCISFHEAERRIHYPLK
jgi:hypothetical protein